VFNVQRSMFKVFRTYVLYQVAIIKVTKTGMRLLRDFVPRNDV